MVKTDWIPAIPIVSHFKYLAVEMYPSLELIGRKNFKFLFKGIKEDLARWGDLTLSISGRISLIKMNILPMQACYLYPLHRDIGIGYKVLSQTLYGKGNDLESGHLSSTKIVRQVV